MNVITHGSLFSGIGGFDLGFEKNGIKTLWQVEILPFCQKVLEKNFPDTERFADVREVGKHNLKEVDIITGGFRAAGNAIVPQIAELIGHRIKEILDAKGEA